MSAVYHGEAAAQCDSRVGAGSSRRATCSEACTSTWRRAVGTAAGQMVAFKVRIPPEPPTRCQLKRGPPALQALPSSSPSALLISLPGSRRVREVVPKAPGTAWPGVQAPVCGAHRILAGPLWARLGRTRLGRPHTFPGKLLTPQGCRIRACDALVRAGSSSRKSLYNEDQPGFCLSPFLIYSKPTF